MDGSGVIEYLNDSINFQNMLTILLLFTFAFISTPYVMGADYSNGLILYHSYDEGNGGVAEDLSGNGHDGKIDLPNWVDGKFKKSLKFNGAGSGTFVTVESPEGFKCSSHTR